MNVHSWIAAFLKNCVQYVVMSDAQSDAVVVDLEVPHGTIVGPLLFLLHMNDLPETGTPK